MALPTYIAIDGGGTKTEGALFTSDGVILRKARRGGSNPNSVGIDAACGVIADVLAELSASGSAPPRGLFAGLAGAISGNRGSEMEKRLRPAYPGLVIESDILDVVYSAESPGKCIAAIMGTGSSVFAYDGRQLHRAGGWGHLLDTAGGGFDIGREVIRACLAYDDGLSPSSPLVRLAEERLGGRAIDLLGDFYRQGPDYIASFAPVAFEALRAGAKDARAIVLASVRRVAELIRSLHARHDCGRRAIFSGGLLRDRDLLEPLLRETLGGAIALEFPTRTQLEGAMRRCLALFPPEP